jgi:hypothetical protein
LGQFIILIPWLIKSFHSRDLSAEIKRKAIISGTFLNVSKIDFQGQL